MESEEAKGKRTKKPEKRGDGPCKKLTLYRRDGKGVVLRDSDGKAIVKEVRWRGHAYINFKGHLIPTEWVTARTRNELKSAKQAIVTEFARKLSSLGAEAYVDTSGKKPIVVDPTPSVLPNPHQAVFTVNDAIRVFLADPEATKEETTRQRYESVWRTHIKVRVDRRQARPLGQLRLHELSREDFKQWDDFVAKPREAQELFVQDKEEQIRWIHRKKLGPKSFAEARNFLRAAINYVVSHREEFPDVVVRFNPGEYKPKRTWSNVTKKTNVVAKDEYDALAAACLKLIEEHPDDISWKSMLALMTLVRHTLRPAEARGLMWRDWDERAGGFRIKRQVVATKGGEQIKDIENGGNLKTSASADLVVVSTKLLPNIEVTKGLSEFVVPSVDDTTKWMSYGSSARRWTELKTLANIDSMLQLYTLKHGMIRDLLVAGKRASEILHLTRHTTTKMIDQVYASLEKVGLAQAIDSMH